MSRLLHKITQKNVKKRNLYDLEKFGWFLIKIDIIKKIKKKKMRMLLTISGCCFLLVQFYCIHYKN